MTDFTIATVAVGEGRLGLCPLPGGGGAFFEDLLVLLNWRPELVLSMTTEAEMLQGGAAGMPADLARRGIGWRHLPVEDFAAESEALQSRWRAASAEAHEILSGGGGVLVHCRGGCGRSGMAVLRLMVEEGEEPAAALARLREARPCAVETAEQEAWGSGLS